MTEIDRQYDVQRPLLHSSVEANVVDQLRKDIVTLALPPGQRLPLEEFGDRYGASLTPLRQALRALTTEGFVTFIPRRGSFVAALSADDLEVISTVSAAVESRLALLGVPALTDEDATLLPTLVTQRNAAAAAADVDGIYRATWRARDLIASRAERPLLHAEATNWRTRIERYQRYLRASARGPEFEKRWASDFAAYIEAATSRDGERAATVTQSTVAWVLPELESTLAAQ